MSSFNGYRVLIMLAGVLALGVSICCPWWSFAEPVPTLHSGLNVWMVEVGYGKWIDVGMVPLWALDEYPVNHWLPFNVIQTLGVLILWAIALDWAARYDAPGR